MEEEENSKKEGRIGKNGEKRIIRVGNRVHNKQVVELGAAVEGGKRGLAWRRSWGKGLSGRGEEG